MKRRTDTPQSVTGRARSILGVFGPDHPALTLSEISDRTGLPITTTFRPLGEFVECGALVRGADRRYRIGPRLIDGHHSETDLKSRRGAETVSSKFPAGHPRL